MALEALHLIVTSVGCAVAPDCLVSVLVEQAWVVLTPPYPKSTYKYSTNMVSKSAGYPQGAGYGEPHAKAPSRTPWITGLVTISLG